VRLLRLSCWSDADLHRVEIRVEAPRMAPRTASARFTFTVPPSDQELIRWFFEVYPQKSADVVFELRAEDAEERLGELGGELFQAVFDASEDTRRLWAAVQPELAEYRVEIVTDVAGATALPWEIMRAPEVGQPLSLQAAALVRAHPYAARTSELPRDDVPVRVLLVISRPGPVDVPFRSVAYQLARLLGDHGGAVRLDVLRPPTFAQLTRTLRDARNDGHPYQVVHFDGHGVWGDVSNARWLQTVIRVAEVGPAALWLVSPVRPGAHGYLLFENPRLAGNTQLIDGPVLGNLLADAGVGLLVLNACRSAQADTTPGPVIADPHAEVRAYGSLAHEVMDTGVAGVLAMRYEVFVATAAQFVADLYAGMVRGESFGAAVRVARQNLAASPSDSGGVAVPDWLVPVAYEAAPLHLISKPDGGDRSDPHQAPTLPIPSDLGFYGRDDTLLALDRAFDAYSVVLLHGEAGIGKTATAAEFARWYLLTGGVPGPVIYTSLSELAGMAALAAQLITALAEDPAAPRMTGTDLAGVPGLQAIRQIMRQVPLLWIWDGLEPASGPPDPGPGRPVLEWKELLSIVHSVRDTRAKLLLISRHDQRAWLGDVPVRLQLPPLPDADCRLLVRAVAAAQQVQLAGLSPTASALRTMAGNPETIIDLTERALRAGHVTSAEFESL
jgi:hypothetical protein